MKRQHTHKYEKYEVKFTVYRLIAILMFLIGAAVVIYPYVAQQTNNLHATRLVNAYLSGEQTQGLPTSSSLPGINQPEEAMTTSAAMDKQTINEIFASIVIPKLNLELPIYLGSSDENLAKGIVVLDGTSLPVGGESTHSVLCGHAGWVSNEWFTHIDRLDEGDIFYIRSPRGDLAYQVISKKIIDPGDTSDLLIQPDADLVTLLTCAGEYQRLIVTGQRLY